MHRILDNSRVYSGALNGRVRQWDVRVGLLLLYKCPYALSVLGCSNRVVNIICSENTSRGVEASSIKRQPALFWTWGFTYPRQRLFDAEGMQER